MSVPESLRRRGKSASGRGHVHTSQLAVNNTSATPDEQVTDPSIRPHDQTGDRIANVAQVVARPHGQVGRGTNFETTKVVATKAVGTAPRSELKHVSWHEGVRTKFA